MPTERVLTWDPEEAPPETRVQPAKGAREGPTKAGWWPTGGAREPLPAAISVRSTTSQQHLPGEDQRVTSIEGEAVMGQLGGSYSTLVCSNDK